MNKLSEYEKPIDENNIQEFENTNQVILPENFKKFLLKNNGGVPEKNMFIAFENDAAFYIHYFFSLKFGEDTLELETDLEYPNGYLTFATTEGSGVFLINLSEIGYGKIYIYYNDGTMEKPLLLADSFEQFLNNLCEEQDF